jgi:hypothetical protein
MAVGLLLTLADADVTYQRLSARIIRPAGLMGQVGWWASRIDDIMAPERMRPPFWSDFQRRLLPVQRTWA